MTKFAYYVRLAIAITLALLLIPIFAWLGLVVIGAIFFTAIVGAIIGYFAPRHHFKTDAEGPIIIDHE